MATQNKKTAKKNETPMQTWNTISGTMRVYGNTFDGAKKGQKIVKWSATISGKNRDDEWENYYIPVKFRGDATEPDEDGLHTIDVENGFFSIESYVNKKGDNIIAPCIIVTACEVVE